ncbi:MAG: DNA adenine methylase [bacterium]|nr:DNA adenine methylase [bacterium]
MPQLPLPGFTTPNRVVNVASVPQRSPFRYPGGKTWLVPVIRQWMTSFEIRPRTLIEPFTGGGIIGLTVAFEMLAEQVHLIEIDEQVAAVWETIITNGGGCELAEEIRQFELTSENVEQLLGQVPQSVAFRALQTIVINRVNRGGILAKGAGRVKAGEAGKGLKSRWYPETLARRIEAIDRIRHRLCFTTGDGMTILKEKKDVSDTAFFIDPPYSASGKKAGQRLYTHHALDHKALFDLTAELQSPFLMTYDDNAYIRDLAKLHGFCVQTVAMKNTHHAKAQELLISRDFSWLV